jgi:hypothetical protein
MMNGKGFGRKLSWPNFKVLSPHSPGGTEENHEWPETRTCFIAIAFRLCFRMCHQEGPRELGRTEIEWDTSVSSYFLPFRRPGFDPGRGKGFFL